MRVLEGFERYRAEHEDLDYPELLGALGVRQPVVPALGFDPAQAKYFDRVALALGMNDDEKTRLTQTGVVALDRGLNASMGDTYEEIYVRDLPVLITSDSILDALHRSYDGMLLQLESAVLAPALKTVLTAAHEELGRQLQEPLPAAVATSLKDVDVYLSVGRSLLAGALDPPPRYGSAASQPSKPLIEGSKAGQDATAKALLDAIAGGHMQAVGSTTAIYGGKRPIDYSQFAPRGHYTSTTELRAYFRAMMWLGRADTGFFLSAPSKESGMTIDVPRERRAASVLTRLVAASQGLPRLGAIERVIDFLVGSPDGLDLRKLASALDAAKLGAFPDLADDLRLEGALASLGEAKAQQITSQVMASPSGPTDRAVAPAAFQFFPQRFTIDAFVLSKVVFDSILYRGEKQERTLPSGLDVMAALGNDEAVRVLEPELRRYHYAANLLAARKTVLDVTPDEWTESLSGRWLDAVRSLSVAPPEGAHFPVAMRGTPWARKELATSLASWAELRHDTLLYAKQSYGISTMCEYPDGFVEPYPAFFDKLAALAHAASERLETLDAGLSEPAAPRSDSAERARGLLRGQSKFFRHFESIMTFLSKLATKELEAQPFTDDERVFLKSTINRTGGSGPPRFDGWYMTLVYGEERHKFKPTIADVHTDPGGNRPPQVLEVGTGRTGLLVVAVDSENDRAVYVGPSFSYFEFTVPPEKRLTDEAWGALLGSPVEPRPPEWVSAFQAKTNRVALGEGSHYGIELTPAEVKEFHRLESKYSDLMRHYPKQPTAAERLRIDALADSIREEMSRILKTGCPPGGIDCPKPVPK